MKGVIWNEAGNVESGVRNAVKVFEKKFGMRPGLVMVNRSRVAEKTVIEGVEVVPVKYLLKNDFFAQEVVR
jgi:hypothetical protein